MRPARVLQNTSVDVLNIAMTCKCHGYVHFLIQDFQCAGNAFFAVCAQAVEERAAYHRAFCAQSPCFEDVLTAADAAVHPDFDVAADCADDVGQGFDGGYGVVELAAAVVGNDQCVRA